MKLRFYRHREHIMRKPLESPIKLYYIAEFAATCPFVKCSKSLLQFVHLKIYFTYCIELHLSSYVIQFLHAFIHWRRVSPKKIHWIQNAWSRVNKNVCCWIFQWRTVDTYFLAALLSFSLGDSEVSKWQCRFISREFWAQTSTTILALQFLFVRNILSCAMCRNGFLST